MTNDANRIREQNKLVEAKAALRKPRNSDGTVYVCKCECGGRVRGAFSFGRLWSYCESCTPVQKVRVKR